MSAAPLWGDVGIRDNGWRPTGSVLGRQNDRATHTRARRGDARSDENRGTGISGAIELRVGNTV